jgi:hypothetical protein
MRRLPNLLEQRYLIHMLIPLRREDSSPSTMFHPTLPYCYSRMKSICHLAQFLSIEMWSHKFLKFFFIVYSFIHMCIHCLGHLSSQTFFFFCLGWPPTMILPISVSQLAMMTGMSHWHLT